MQWSDLKTTLLEAVGPYSQTHKRRLNFEISEVEKQGAEAYWCDLHVSGKKYKKNVNKLLLPFLLGMVEEDPVFNRSTPMLNSIRASSVLGYKEKNGCLPEDFSKDTDMPDIDIDCLPESRDPLKEYAILKYSSHIDDAYGSVCSVGTWQTFKFKSAIIDAAAALDVMSRFDAQRYTTEMPITVDELRENGRSTCKGRIITEEGEKECGFGHAEEKCPKCGSPDTESPTLMKLLAEDVKTKSYPDGPLRTLYKEHPDVVNYAAQLVGRVRNMGMHAGALIITDRPLYGNIPLSKSSSKGFWTSMWTEGRTTQLSKFGYIKWDLLGLKTLKYIHRACQLIKENRGISFSDNFEGMEYNDPELRHAGYYFDANGKKHFIKMDDHNALNLANERKTDGVFQFDTDLAKQTLENGVRSFEDLMLLSAMGHPGPMAMIPEAVKNRDDKTQSWQQEMDPLFLACLKETYGVIVYQEQLQALWQNVAGFTGPEAQEARKAVAKKWTHKLKDIEKKWMIGASAMIGEARALEEWQKQISFGRYAFNKSHAVAYSLIALRCLWLKAHFAPEFWAAIMSDCHPEKLIRYMGVARSEGWDSTSITYCGTYDPKVRSKKVQFGTLDINNLQTDFSVTKDHVNQGLTGIKGIGDKAAEIFSGKGNFKSIDEFIEGDGRKSKLVLERFIKLQAFKDLDGHGNSKAVWIYYQYHHCSGVRELKQEVDTKILALEGWNDRTIREERERLVTEYRISYPKRNKIPVKIQKWQPKPVVSLFNINRITTEDFTYEERLGFQKEFIGYYIDDPMRVYDINGQGTIEMAKERTRSHKEAYLEALVVSYEVAKSKNEKEFGKLKVTDGLADCTVFIFGRDLGRQDSKCLVPGTGVYVPVEYDIEKKLFRLGHGEMILKLQKI